MEVLVIGMNGLPVLQNAVEEIKQDQDDAITQRLNSEDQIALVTLPNVSAVIWILALQLAQLKNGKKFGCFIKKAATIHIYDANRIESDSILAPTSFTLNYHDIFM